MENRTLFGEPDELDLPERGSYTEDKYDFIRLYCALFSSGMRYKWKGKRVYIDLYAGSGKCRIKGTNKVLLGSPLIALSMDVPFDRYIFCESDQTKMSALKQRVERLHSLSEIHWVPRDCNGSVEQISALIDRDNLVLCLVDPNDCDIHQDTLKTLSQTARGVDFLCLLATGMDAKRAASYYLQPENTKLDDMLGNAEWRNRWPAEEQRGEDFGKFLALEFAQSMQQLGYRKTEIADMKLIKLLGKNVPLYYLALFSKHPKAFEFWAQVLKYAGPQRGLFD
jgi:three-Cys-motif partner protein